MPFANINGQRLFYADSGGDKPVVLFLHGFLFDQSMFDRQVAALAAEYRCVRFDARAHGQTQWDGQAFTLYDTLADCIGLLDHLEIEQASVVGMTQGGYVLIRMGLHHPERLKTAVFASTYNGVDTDEVKSVHYAMRDAWSTPDGKRNMINVLSSIAFGGDRQLEAQWCPVWENLPAQNLFHAMNCLVNRDVISAEQMKTILHPALVIHGEADHGMPLILAEMTLFRVLPHVTKLVRIPNAAQAINLVNPPAFNGALKLFLDTYAR